MRSSRGPARGWRLVLSLLIGLTAARVGVGQTDPPAVDPIPAIPSPPTPRPEAASPATPPTGPSTKPAPVAPPEGAGQPADSPKTDAPPAGGPPPEEPPLALDSLFDSLHKPSAGKPKPWYERISLRGYAQIRYGRALTGDPLGGPPALLGDRSVGADTGTFSIRRARLIVSEETNEYLRLYFQSDFANNPADGTTTYFAQIRDLYGDVYLTRDKAHRLRVGQSKIPWGFEEMQSSSLRIPLDRSEAIDSGDSPNQRDLGVFYYWTPVGKQKLLKELATGGLRGTGDYGVFAFGVYNGQGGSQIDLNRSLHTVARVTWPFQLPDGQAVEVSLQGYTGKFVVDGMAIRPLGVGPSAVPTGTGYPGLREQRVAASFVWYPQPVGFQTEWNVGEGPGLNDAQTTVQVRSLQGGYAMATYKHETEDHGIFIPYVRYQHYRGGYRSVPNAPFGTHDEYNVGVKWLVRRDLELTAEYGFVDGVGLDPVDLPGVDSYRAFRSQVLRVQMQINY